jgi:integrase
VSALDEAAPVRPQSTEAQVRLALSPAFASDVIVLDNPAWAETLFGTCAVDSCLRFRRTRDLCMTHLARWRAAGQPAIQAFLADPGPPSRPERIVLAGIDEPLCLEIALAVQLAATSLDDHPRVMPSSVQRIIEWSAAQGATTIRANQPRSPHGTKNWPKVVLGTLSALRQVLEEYFGDDPDPQSEFERDVWRLPLIGATVAGVGSRGRLRFDGIAQPWLRLLAKKFARWRIATGASYDTLNRDQSALQRLSEAFTAQAGPNATVADFTRETIEVFLTLLASLDLSPATRSYSLSSVSAFLDAVRRHGWEPDLPATAGVYPNDHPRRPAALPRALPEYVMAQIEAPAAQEQLAQPHRLMLRILIDTGLRLADAYKLKIDCLTHDPQGAPYLRYFNHKMDREAVVPIDDELAAQIAAHQRRVLEETSGTVYLAPSHVATDGSKHWSNATVTNRLTAWQEQIGLRDEAGRPFRFTAHQLRHTYGTRLINADVPQEVVRRLLDHESPEMTARYARLHDSTIRRHWENARKIDIHGQTVALDAGGALSDAAWMKENLGRATMTLPNGYCGLPLQQTCPHANACLTCPVFVTTPDFLSEHLAQLRATNHLIAEAQAKGQTRVVEMNQQVATNLQNIIAAIKTADDDGTDDAS